MIRRTTAPHSPRDGPGPLPGPSFLSIRDNRTGSCRVAVWHITKDGKIHCDWVRYLSANADIDTSLKMLARSLNQDAQE